jgi:hypothetical protein
LIMCVRMLTCKKAIGCEVAASFEFSVIDVHSLEKSMERASHDGTALCQSYSDSTATRRRLVAQLAKMSGKPGLCVCSSVRTDTPFTAAHALINLDAPSLASVSLCNASRVHPDL